MSRYVLYQKCYADGKQKFHEMLHGMDMERKNERNEKAVCQQLEDSHE